MIAFYTILFTAGSTPTDAIAPGVEIPPHDHPPAWLTIFSLLLPATAVEYGKRMPLWLQGIGGGALWSVLLYGFSSRFLEPEFQYGDADAFIAIFASILGGLCAGIAVQKLRRRFTTSV